MANALHTRPAPQSHTSSLGFLFCFVFVRWFLGNQTWVSSCFQGKSFTNGALSPTFKKYFKMKEAEEEEEEEEEAEHSGTCLLSQQYRD